MVKGPSSANLDIKKEMSDQHVKEWLIQGTKSVEGNK
jgi:hypothetical protein